MSKYCINCGNMLSDDSKFCNKCGVDTKNNQFINNANNVENSNQNVNATVSTVANNNQETSKVNGLAIASFVVSLVGLIIFGLYCGLIALGMGITALKRIKIFPEMKGKGLAIAGIVIGSIDVFFVLLATIINILLVL